MFEKKAMRVFVIKGTPGLKPRVSSLLSDAAPLLVLRGFLYLALPSLCFLPVGPSVLHILKVCPSLGTEVGRKK